MGFILGKLNIFNLFFKYEKLYKLIINFEQIFNTSINQICK